MGVKLTTYVEILWIEGDLSSYYDESEKTWAINLSDLDIELHQRPVGIKIRKSGSHGLIVFFQIKSDDWEYESKDGYKLIIRINN